MHNHDKSSIINLLICKLRPQMLKNQPHPVHISSAVSDYNSNNYKPMGSPVMKESTMERNTSELKNPLPDKIPDIVWDDLLYSEKEQIIDAVKLSYNITYFHTKRQPERERTLADTGVIEIGDYAVSCIYSRATSERGITKLDNPVMNIIPCNIWNNLPDVLKEEIIKGINYNNEHDGYDKFSCSYSSYENKISIGYGCFGNWKIDKYDAKRGVFIGSLFLNSL
jgi:hypothetical protein